MRETPALFGSVCGVTTAAPVFALTFDDGPERQNTPQVLEALAEHRARATFFVLVPHARELRSLVLEAIAAGHEIGLHGKAHVDLSASSPRTVIASIRRARAELEDLLSAPVTVFRPPYGAQSPFSYLVARASGLEVVMWSASPRDFLDVGAERQVALALSELERGGIMLMHDGPPTAAERRRRFVELIVEGAGAAGLGAVTAGELLGYGPATRRRWLHSRERRLRDEIAPFKLQPPES